MAKVRFTETALRDAHQSLLATRMRTEDMIPIAEEMEPIVQLPTICLTIHQIVIWRMALTSVCHL